MTRYYIESLKRHVSTNYTLSELKSYEKEIKTLHNQFSGIKDNFFLNILSDTKQDLKSIQKLQRKVNGYKNIIITEEGDYDSYSTIIDFPKGTRKDFKHQWLRNNNYPTESEFYNINSMYDCTGQVHSVYVTYDKNKVIITSYRDL